MEKKLLLSLLNQVAPKNSTLPILENVWLDKDRVIAYNLETAISIPFNSGIESLVPAKEFISAMEMMKEPQFSRDIEKVIIQEGKKVIKLVTDELHNYPRIYPTEAEFKPAGEVLASNLPDIEKALKFVSNDDLRPAMTGVYFADQIAATDAHRLYWKQLDQKFEIPFILPPLACKLLVKIGGEWKVERGQNLAKKEGKGKSKDSTPVILNDHIKFTNSEGVIIFTKPIDARYPDYKVVIPRDKDKVATLSVDKKELMQELKTCLKFTNPYTNMVKITLNGTAQLSSEDIDTGKEYSTELESAKATGELQIGVNGKFLLDIVNDTDAVKIKMFGPSKALIINDSYLVMPLMINL